MPGTWPAARAAVDATLTAVDLVVSGARSAYALTRPPGHHVDALGVRRLLLSQQRRRRGHRPAGRWSRPRGRRRHRRPPRQRHAGRVLRPQRRALCVDARGPRGRLVPALRRVRGRDRHRRRGPRKPQRAAGPGLRRSCLARRRGPPCRGRRGARRHRTGRVARGRCRSGRPREPAAR